MNYTGPLTPYAESCAEARLYDAAPWMLEMLEMVALVKPTCGVYLLDEHSMKQIRGAIARATGESA